MEAINFSKKLSLVGIILILTGLIAGCNQENQSLPPSNHTPESVSLKVLYSTWPPDMISFIAQEKGFFKQNNVAVNLVWDNGLTEASQIRKEAQIDIWAYPLLDFLAEYSSGEETEAQVFMIEDFSAGADAVITLPEKKFTSIADLKGKKIGVEKGTVGEFFLNILLQKKDLTLADVEAIDIAFDQILPALQNGIIDAGVTYEPEITSALAEGAIVLIDSKQERNAIVDVFVAKKDNLAQNPEIYKNFIQSILDASAYLEKNPTAAAEIIKEQLEMTTEEVVETFAKLKLPNLRENKTAFDRSSGFASLYTLARKAQQYLEEQNPEMKQFDLEPLIYSDLINAIE
jgi:NitT/TauT family transport system substrate-binding protein